MDQGVTPVIQPEANRKSQHECDFALYCERNLIERFLTRLALPRRCDALRQTCARLSRRSSVGRHNHPAQLRTGPTSLRASGLASAASPATASAASPATAPAASPPGKFFADLGRSGVLLVEDIERRQADVRELLLTESDFVTRCGVPRPYVHCWPTGSGRCAGRKRQRNPSDSQHRYGFPRTLSLRGMVRMRHSRVLSSKYS